MAFEQVGRQNQKLNLALDGPAGSGKTFSALRIAHSLGEKVFVIDSERGSSRLYFGEEVDGKVWNFYSCILPTFSVDYYINAIDDAKAAGADVIVIDGISQAWNGANGVLEVVENVGSQKDSDGRAKGNWSGWKVGGKVHSRLLDKILSSDVHTISTMRTKMKYQAEQDSKTGKLRIEKVGVRPIQRDGTEYEFDLILRMEKGVGTVTKTRCKLIPDGEIYIHPGQQIADLLASWLNSPCFTAAGTPAPAAEAVQEEEVPQTLDDDVSWFAETNFRLTTETVDDAKKMIQDAVASQKISMDEIARWKAVRQIAGKLTDEQALELGRAIEAHICREKVDNEIPF